MRLQKLILQNFRVFHGIHEFNFKDKSLIILDGPNGHGKSSLFDSIQWCLTGDIQRYRGTSEHQNFNYLINSEAFKILPVTMKVEIWLSSVDNTELIKITRSIRETKSSSTTKIYINDEEYNLREGREKIKNILVNTDWIERDVDNAGNIEDIDFARFFSTSQLLSQDQLRAFIQNTNPKERFRVLENLLGLKKYGVHFNTYLNEINEILKGRLVENQKSLDAIQKEYVEVNTNLKNQIESLQLVGNIPEEILKQQINELLSSIPVSLLTIHKIYEINNDSQSHLINIRKNLTKEINKIETDSLNVKNILTDLKTLPTDDETKKEDLNKKLIELQRTKSLRVDGLNRCKIKLSDLSIVEQKQKEFQGISKTIQTLMKKRDTLQIEYQNISNHALMLDLKKENISYNDFKTNYLETQKDFKELQRVQEIKELEDTLINSTDHLKDYKSHKQICEQQATSLKKELQQLEEVLGEIDKARESHINDRINELVYAVQQHILNISTQQDCIVCGSTFEDSDHLNKEIREQIEFAESLRTTIDQKYIEHSSKKKVLEETYAKVTKELKDLAKNMNILQDSINTISSKIENSKVFVSNIDLLNMSKEHLQRKMKKTGLFLETYRITYSLIETLEKSLLEQDVLQKEILNQNNILKNISIGLGKYSKYLDQDQNILQTKKQLMKNYELKASQFLNAINQQITQAENERRQLEYNLNSRQNKIQQIINIIPNFNGDTANLEQTIHYYEEQREFFTDLDNSLKLILQQIKVFLSQEELLDLRKKENSLRNYITECESNNQLFNKLICDIDDSKKNHTTVQSRLMTNYLLGYSEIIDKLFMQISPHAIYRHVHLVSRDGNLYIIMSRKSSKEEDLSQLSNEELEARFNASLTFSSGQASVLAVCIFLALNQGQNWTNLKFLGIDDPFQNMDDVNAFSFIDVLSQLSLEKQIFISTHSKEFTALMRAKVGVSNDKIGYINFQSYSGNNIDFKTNCSL